MVTDSAPNVPSIAASGSNGDMDSSSQPAIIEHMAPDLHNAAVKGEGKTFEGKPLESILTPYMNTILHVHIMAFSNCKGKIFKNIRQRRKEKKSIKFIQEILDKCPSLLLKANAKGDTLLHVAAANGHLKIVKGLTDYARTVTEPDLEDGSACPQVASEMLQKKDKEGSTALEVAVRHGYSDVMQLFLESDKPLPLSKIGPDETPGSMAYTTEQRSIEKSYAYPGAPRKTALHYAVKIDNLDITTKLLERDKDLIHVPDENWWTPLHYAAYYGCSKKLVLKLLELDRSAAYIADKNRKMAPLHLAAAQGHDIIIKTIISKCPDCYELVDNRGWNILHFAMLSSSLKELESFLKDPLHRSLLYEKDSQGYTPLHVLVSSRRNAFVYIVNHKRRFPLNYKRFSHVDLLNLDFSDIKKKIEELSENVGSGAGPYPRGVINIKRIVRDEDISVTQKAKQSHLVVAALIATVTFAAGFTLPGGYKETDGTAILRKNPAFGAFVIADAVAMVYSMSAIFIYFIMSLKKFQKQIYLLEYASTLTIVATGAMVVAFGTGTYAVLRSSWLAVATCIIALSYFPMLIRILLLTRKGDYIVS